MNQNEFNNQQPVQPVTPVTPVEPTVVPQATPVAPVQPTMVQPPVQPVPEPTKKKSILPIILILLVLVLAGGGTGAYFLFFHKVSAKQVVDGTLNTMFSKAAAVETAVDKVFTFNYKNDIVQGTGNLKLDVEGSADGEKLELKNIDFDYDLISNIKNKELSTKISTSQNSKEIVNLQAFVQNNKAYVNSNVFTTPYVYDLNNTTFWDDIIDITDKMPEYNSGDLKTVVSKIKQYVRHSIKDEYLTQADGNFTIDGTNISGVKTTIELSTTRLNDMEIGIINEMIADEELIGIIAKYEMISTDAVKNSLYDEIDNIKASKETILPEKDIKYNINIYTTKQGKFLALEVTSDGKVALTAVSNNNVTTFKIYDDDGNVEYEFTYDEVNKEYVFKIEEYTLKVQFITDGVKLSLTGNDLDLSLSLTNTTADNLIKNTVDFNGSYKEGTNNVKGSLKYTSELKKAEKIETFDVANARPYEEITPEEQQAISTNVTEAISGTYIEVVMQLLSLLNPTYNDPYTTYDYYGI